MATVVDTFYEIFVSPLEWEGGRSAFVWGLKREGGRKEGAVPRLPAWKSPGVSGCLALGNGFLAQGGACPGTAELVEVYNGVHTTLRP